MATQSEFAPVSLEQAVVAVKTEKWYRWISISAGLITFGFVAWGLNSSDTKGIYFLPLSILAGSAVYLVLLFFLLPLIWPPKVRCPHCGNWVAILTSALPRLAWPRVCPHCNEALVSTLDKVK